MTEKLKTAEPGEKPQRRWYSFRLRTLLIFVTLAGSGFGWPGFKVQESQRQQAAVAAIENLGGAVMYDYEFDRHGGHLPNAEPPGPSWLHTLLGDDFFRTACQVFLYDIADERSPIDTRLENLKALPHLKRLVLDCAPQTLVTDASLENVKGLAKLEYLSLMSRNISDAGFDHFKGLVQLKDLSVVGTTVTDAGLESLQGLAKLENLWLDSPNITDAGLDRFKGLIQLKRLRLSRTKVTDAGVARLHRALPNCEITR